MTSFNSQDFKVGPCGVVFNREILGITQNPSPVTLKKKGLDQNETDITASLRMEIISADKLPELFFGDSKVITFNMLKRRQENIKGGELLLIPIGTSNMTAYRFSHAVPFPICSTCTFSTVRECTMTLEFEVSYVEKEKILFERISVDEAQKAEILLPEIDPALLERAVTAYIADKLGVRKY